MAGLLLRNFTSTSFGLTHGLRRLLSRSDYGCKRAFLLVMPWPDAIRCIPAWYISDKPKTHLYSKNGLACYASGSSQKIYRWCSGYYAQRGSNL